MNDNQQRHLAKIKSEMLVRLDKKYRAGVREHKTTLNKDHSVEEVLEMLLEEVTDLITYAITLEELIKNLKNNRTSN